jgi:NAD(P)-dependent dehydrogenase (short-subunit alcohol dehydrogenase family)
MRLAGKTAVITGAGSGIGAAAAVLFAQEGARVVVADRQTDQGTAVVAAIMAAGGEAVFVPTDVSRRADNEHLLDACLARYGRLDILFCNAGINLPKLLPATSDDEMEALFGVNVRGLVYATRYAIPIMLRQGGGVILINASKTGLVAQRDSPLYCATKGAAVLLARALALDYATQGIRVNALCPGVIDTPMLRYFADAQPDPAAAWAEYSAQQPMGRLGTAEECARAALWLVSDEASFITGVALPVDGGFTAL